jgi:two-component system, OmpR family, copper resistance phosphate regulon response regulator CusR
MWNGWAGLQPILNWQHVVEPNPITMRTLLIEPEKRLADYLSHGLTESSFVVDVVDNGIDGLHLGVTGEYDLFVLDRFALGLDGWRILTELRKAKTIPILVLTGPDCVADRVKGLELGADDCLAKPFAYCEFLARAYALLRRGNALEPQTFRIADLEVDLAGHKVVRNSERVDLTPKEFSLLLLLLRHRGKVLSHTTIAEQVWDINFDSDTNVVEVTIRRLRAKIDDASKTKLIHTVRGVGYVLEHRDWRPAHAPNRVGLSALGTPLIA